MIMSGRHETTGLRGKRGARWEEDKGSPTPGVLPLSDEKTLLVEQGSTTMNVSVQKGLALSVTPFKEWPTTKTRSSADHQQKGKSECDMHWNLLTGAACM